MRRFPLLLALVALAPRAVAAQEPHPECAAKPGSADEARRLAGVWFARADKAVAEGKFDEGLGAYACSYRMVEHPATLYNMAQTANLAGKKDVALTLARDYLRKDPYGDMVDPAKQLIAELEKQGVGVKKPEPGPAPVEPAPAEPAPEPAPAPAPEPAPEPADGKPVDLAIIGWSAVGVGGAAAIAGGVLQGLAIKAKGDAESAKTYADYEDLEDERGGLQNGATACFAVGGAALVAGVVLLLLDDDPEPAKDAVRIEPAGLGIAGRF